MRLNVDCIRDVMLVLEDSPYGKHFSVRQLCELLTEYSEEDISYTCLKLTEADFITALVTGTLGLEPAYVKDISDITFSGHQFLADIHSDTIWNGVKSVAAKLGVASVSSLTQIVSSTTLALIKSHFGI